MGYYYEPQYTALFVRKNEYACYRGDSWGFRPDGSEDFSISLWFWPDNPNARLLNGGNILTLDLQDNQLIFWLKGLSDLTCEASVYPLLRHEWNHVVVTFNHLGQVQFYINGMLNQVYSVFQDKKATKWEDIFFGQGLEGYLRSVKFYNKCLSDSEVEQVKRNADDASVPIRWFDFETAVPEEKITKAVIELCAGAKPYSLADGLFCDNGEGFFPLDGDVVNPASFQDAPYTVQAWISIYDTEQSFAILFMNGRHMLDCGMVLYLEKDTDGYHLCAGRGIHTQEKNILRSTHVLSTRAWHNVAVTYDSLTMRIYIDGVLEKESADLVPFTEMMGYGFLRIGTDDLPGLSDAEGCFHGAIGNIVVWNRALTVAELEKYAASWPQAGENGLMADYIFTRYSCCNAATGFEVSMASVNTEKVCRNPITSDYQRASLTAAAEPAVLLTLHGKTAAELHQEHTAVLPDAEAVLNAILADLSDEVTDEFRMSLLRGYRAHQEKLLSGEHRQSFYLHERGEDGIYRFYFISDQIYPAGEFSLNGRGEFAAWVIRLISTLIIDVFSIYCVLPASAAQKIPAAFQSSSLFNEKVIRILQNNRDAGIKKIIGLVCKFLLGGGLLTHLIEQLKKDGAAIFLSNIVSLVFCFFAKASTPFGWLTVFCRVAVLVYDMVSIISQMPKLLGAELTQLLFRTGSSFLQATCFQETGSPKLVPHWQKGQDSSNAVPVVCCLRQAQSQAAGLSVSAQFSVYTNGAYSITATASMNWPLGKIEQKNVQLEAGKDGTCTVLLKFTDTMLTNAAISDLSLTLNWSIVGKHTTDTEKTSIRVFFLYDLPQLPWGGKSGFGTPWLAALELVCNYANGISGSSDAQWRENIIHRLMEKLWEKCTAYSPNSRYVSDTQFYLTRWLEDEKKDNCIMNDNDCAALLVTLCNLLGCHQRSVLLSPKEHSTMATREIIQIGSRTSKSYELTTHETTMELRGIKPYYSDLCYKMQEKPNDFMNPVMRPLHTENNTTGLCEMFLTAPEDCVVPSNQRSIGDNGIRTIM